MTLVPPPISQAAISPVFPVRDIGRFPNTVPFTYRDASTFAEMFEQWTAWVEGDVLPHVTDNANVLSDAYNVASQALAAAMSQYTGQITGDRTAFDKRVSDTLTAITKSNGDTATTIGQSNAATVQSVGLIRQDAVAARTGAEAARDTAQQYSATTQALQDAAVAGLLGGTGSLPANASTAALAKAIRLLTTARTYKARVGFMGDSITDTGIAGVFTTGGQWWALAAALTQKYWPTVQAGRSGETTTSMRARIATNFPAGSIDVGMILGGTNDVGQAFPLSTTIDNITFMVDYIRSIGAVPILGTIPPRAENDKVSAINNWVKSYGLVNNITVVDFWSVLADPATNLYKDGLTSDGIHPTPAGHKIMAIAFKNAISGSLTGNPAEVVATSTTDTRNALAHGIIDTWQADPVVPAPTLTAGGNGSPLAAGTYYYKTAYLGYAGESPASAEASITITAGQVITLTAPVVAGQGKVVIYRSNAAGAELFMVEVNAGGGSTTYVDNGSVLPAGPKTPSNVNHYSAPTGWSSGLGLGSLSVTKVTNDATFIGDAVDIEGRAGTLAQITNYGNLPVKWDIGDIIAVSFKVRSFGGQVNRAYIHLRNSGGADVNTGGYTQGNTAAFTGDTYRYYQEIPLSADVYSVGVDFATDGPRLRAGDVSIINLTKLGLR